MPRKFKNTNTQNIQSRNDKLSKLSSADFWIDAASLPDFEPSAESPAIQLWGGHLPVGTEDPDPADAHYYFLLQRARHVADKERVVIWLNGGPGCSSFDAVMMETGAWRTVRLDNDPDDPRIGLKEVAEKTTWNEYAHMIYLDQPAGTGFSYAETNSYYHDVDQVQAAFVQFLKNFYKVFPEYQHLDTYIAGESFAGTWIPHLALAVLDADIPTPLKGIMIGNGWIDPLAAVRSWPQFGLDRGLYSPGTEEAHKVDVQRQVCENFIKDSQAKHDADPSVPMPINTPICDKLMFAVASAYRKSVDGKQSCLNIYDIRLTDTYPACGMNWPPEIHDTGRYLRRQDVVKAIHAEAKSMAWTECNHQVYAAATFKHSRPSIEVMPDLLARIPALIFAGDQDLICNTQGQHDMIAALNWNGQQGFGAHAIAKKWTVDNVPAGTWTIARNLTYVEIYNASHMAAYDKAQETLDMMLRFLDLDLSKVEGTTSRPMSFLEDELSKPSKPQSGGVAYNPNAWESYYNAGSAVLLLVVFGLLFVALYACRRGRWPRLKRRTATAPDEERIAFANEYELDERLPHRSTRPRSGHHSPGGEREELFTLGNEAEEA